MNLPRFSVIGFANFFLDATLPFAFDWHIKSLSSLRATSFSLRVGVGGVPAAGLGAGAAVVSGILHVRVSAGLVPERPKVLQLRLMEGRKHQRSNSGAESFGNAHR